MALVDMSILLCKAKRQYPLTCRPKQIPPFGFALQHSLTYVTKFHLKMGIDYSVIVGDILQTIKLTIIVRFTLKSVK